MIVINDFTFCHGKQRDDKLSIRNFFNSMKGKDLSTNCEFLEKVCADEVRSLLQ